MVNSSGLPSVQVPPPYREWKLEQDASNRLKRKHEDMGTPLDEALPPHGLEHDKILCVIPQMFSNLTKLVEKYESISPENAELMKVLKRGYNVPRAKPFVVAFLGEQGIGKSTIINALLGRSLVTKSAGSSACTSFPTYITYKAGAPDDTTRSDVTVNMLDEEAMGDFIETQISSYAECYPVIATDEQDEDGNGDSSESGSESDDEDTADSSDEDENGDITYPANQRGVQKISKRKKRDAETARDFFEIIFGAKIDEEAQVELDNLLNTTDITNEDDIQNGDFFRLCLRKVEHCREQLNSVLQKWQNVSDKGLSRIRNQAQKFWPLIDSIVIATGHMMLRYNIIFKDLPGENDMSSKLG
jgi:hypothetical protein